MPSSNPNALKEKARRKRQRKKEFVEAWKAESGCARCGMKDVRCLHAHHKGPKNPRLANQPAWQNLSWGQIYREIEVCEVLCANCHEIEHHEQDSTDALVVGL